MNISLVNKTNEYKAGDASVWVISPNPNGYYNYEQRF